MPIGDFNLQTVRAHHQSIGAFRLQCSSGLSRRRMKRRPLTPERLHAVDSDDDDLTYDKLLRWGCFCYCVTNAGGGRCGYFAIVRCNADKVTQSIEISQPNF